VEIGWGTQPFFNPKMCKRGTIWQSQSGKPESNGGNQINNRPRSGKRPGWTDPLVVLRKNKKKNPTREWRQKGGGRTHKASCKKKKAVPIITEWNFDNRVEEKKIKRGEEREGRGKRILKAKRRSRNGASPAQGFEEVGVSGAGLKKT